MDRELKFKAIIEAISGIIRIAFQALWVDNIETYLKMLGSALIQFFLCNIAAITAIIIIVVNPDMGVLGLSFLLVITVFFLFLTNVIIEFFMLLGEKDDAYDELLDRQKRIHNQGLIIVSLLALCVSAFLSGTDTVWGNIGLLFIGILLFLATVLIDAYDLVVHKKGCVKDLVVYVKKLWIGDF